jgi:hypothetical protein
VKTPCRLFVYLANDAPLAVVLRRGPTDWVRLSLWNTADDTLEHGQWMKNRVYERRCDLSADGTRFVYFARGSSGPAGIFEANRDSWVAVSRPPWFSALALWFVGGTYYTGGFFPDRHTLWFGFGSDHGEPDVGSVPPSLHISTDHPPHIDRTNDWPDRTVWLNRLLRDGWSPVNGAKRETWQRARPNGDLVLLMSWPADPSAAFNDPLSIEYALLRESDGDMIPVGAASWADWDQRGRLVLAKDGRLFEWKAPDRFVEIADFNTQEPDPAPSPPDTRIW